MKIFYTASYYGKKTYQQYYNFVLQALKQTRSTIISPEIGNYKEVLTPSDLKRLRYPKKIHYEAIRKGILQSDAVVIEISHEDFQLGHEATLAIQSKKYVLCLSTHEDFSEKINNKYFIAAKYNEYNIEEIVDNFLILVNKNKYSSRFNCFLTPQQLQYLESASKKEGINMSEYLRNLIDQDQENI